MAHLKIRGGPAYLSNLKIGSNYNFSFNVNILYVTLLTIPTASLFYGTFVEMLFCCHE